MMNRRIWIFSGPQGSGKTTYADALRETLGRSSSFVMKFADVIYDLHNACLPVLHGYKIRPVTMKKDGDLLQVLGTEYGRKCLGESVWVDVLRKRANDFLEMYPKSILIIDDMRFENEFNAFAGDAYMIRLWAPESTRKARCSSWRENVDHPSETGLDEFERKKMFHCLIDTSNKPNPTAILQELVRKWNWGET